MSNTTETSLIEASASGTKKGLMRADITWTTKELPFEEGFEERFNLALGVFQEFLIKGSDYSMPLKEYNPESLFVHVHLCGDHKMRSLNKLHRGKDKTTDVLSFPLYENLREGDDMIFSEIEIGDVIISIPVMKKQAVEFKVTQEQEFFHLLTHGILHLTGFDHEVSDEEERIMEELEQMLIKKIYKKIY